ncbi:pentatricopeptide repeat-containing protein At5g61800-like [Zingiber officinale]|uniref:pentatricopeptide repeat-containing protein At5g61800-like n=1 Tax=Zingiber officinale TaxID=94328 RepID=UPI001C4BFA14|nr:pentatricopeptide repeat-containing protein At5g61800-like [Zingiber officinale]
MPSREFSHRQLFHLLHRRCKSLRHLKAIHAHATIHGLTSLYPSPILAKLIYTLTLLLPTAINHRSSLPAASTASVGYALSLFHAIPFPSAFPYNLLMRVHTLLSSPLSALLLYACMRRSAACTRLRHPFLADIVHCQAIVFGFADDLYVRNTLINTYSSFYSMPKARTIFDECPSLRDVVSYNILMDGYVKASQIEHTRNLFDGMPKRDVVRGLFFSYFKELVGKEVTVELKNDLAIRGTLHSVDQYLNIKLENIKVIDEDKYPHMLLHLSVASGIHDEETLEKTQLH